MTALPRPALLLLAAALSAAVATAGARADAGPVINHDGVALNGYDVVAYHRRHDARRGIAIHEAEFGGYRWHFENDINLGRFLDDPVRYLPAYGGHSADAVAEGYLIEGDPEVWSIKDGRLFLFFSPPLLRKWLEDAGPMIRRGDRNWVRLRRR